MTDQDLMNPDWDNTSKFHDWRNHIGEHTQAIWQSLTIVQRNAIALDAEGRASLEEWE